MRDSPKQYLQTLRPRSVDDVFGSSVPSLSGIASGLGENKARAAVVLLLDEVVGFFNVGNTMDASQVAVTTDLIIEEYPYFQLDDLNLAFRNAMKGRYGEVYNRLDGLVVMGWLKKYEAERCARADILSYNEHRQLMGQESGGLYYDDYRNMLRERASKGDREAAAALKRSDDTLAFMKAKRLDKQKRQLEEYDRKRREEKELRDQVQQKRDGGEG